MNARLKLLPAVLSTLLAACVSAPSHQSSKAPQRAGPAESTASPSAQRVPAPSEEDVQTTTSTPPAGDASTVWERLRESFAMADCEADPAIEAWARRLTHNPSRFEDQLQAVLPRLVYVEKVASRYKVPGEFALIPWVESHFQPVPGKRNRPAGMWQIMPVTARAMGLRVDGHYDGRMDIPAAANAVMKMLAHYHDQFHDWRVADYAYNAGEFSIRRIIRKHGMPPALPTIPDWPVRNVTRGHLTKLLGMACVVRDPSRFHVTLPTLPQEQQLVQVGIPHSMSLSRAADHAGLSMDLLTKLNSAFRDGQLDAGAVSYLMLPASHAEQFADATQRPQIAGINDSASSTDPRGDSPSAEGLAPRVHTVRPGESLWKIARIYQLKVTELKRWNHLSDSTLRPGQRLRLSDAH